MSDPDCPVMPGGPCMRRPEDDGSAWGRCRWCDRALDDDVIDLGRVKQADRMVDEARRLGVRPERTADYLASDVEG